MASLDDQAFERDDKAVVGPVVVKTFTKLAGSRRSQLGEDFEQLFLSPNVRLSARLSGVLRSHDRVDHPLLGKSNMVTELLGRGVRYYEPIRTYSFGGLSYDAAIRKVFIHTDGLGGTDGAKGVNPVVNATVQELRTMKTVMTTTRDRLAGALGFSKSQPEQDTP